jgi:hypothetical protein
MMRGEESSEFEARHDVYSPERNLPCCSMLQRLTTARLRAGRRQGNRREAVEVRQNAAMRAADGGRKAMAKDTGMLAASVAASGGAQQFGERRELSDHDARIAPPRPYLSRWPASKSVSHDAGSVKQS